MEIDFFKMRIGGYCCTLVPPSTPENTSRHPEIARTLNDPLIGTGTSGTLYVLPSENGGKIDFYNLRGESIPPPIDAQLCAARYLFDTGITGTESVMLETMEGKRQIELLNAETIRLYLPLDSNLHQRPSSVSTERDPRPVFDLCLGTSCYQILYMEDVEEEERKRLGQDLWQRNPLTPALFVRNISPRRLDIAPVDRYTEIDQTAAAAIAFAHSFTKGFCDEEGLAVLGGEVPIYVQCTPREVSVTATAEYVFSGKIWIRPDKEN